MLRKLPPRVMPVLLLQDSVLVKTSKFKQPVYVGDPINTVNLFNQFEVDEIVVLDISVSKNNRQPNFDLIENIASECWVPITYGGGIRTLEDARRILNSGVEKILIQSLLFDNLNVVSDLVTMFGSSSIVGCINVSKNFFGKYILRQNNLRVRPRISLDGSLDLLTSIRVGEVVINDVTRDGTLNGYDYELIRYASNRLTCPFVALGGAGNMDHLFNGIQSGAHAVAAGSMFVFGNKSKESILVNFPSRESIEEVFCG